MSCVVVDCALKTIFEVRVVMMLVLFFMGGALLSGTFDAPSFWTWPNPDRDSAFMAMKDPSSVQLTTCDIEDQGGLDVIRIGAGGVFLSCRVDWSEALKGGRIFSIVAHEGEKTRVVGCVDSSQEKVGLEKVDVIDDDRNTVSWTFSTSTKDHAGNHRQYSVGLESLTVRKFFAYCVCENEELFVSLTFDYKDLNRIVVSLGQGCWNTFKKIDDIGIIRVKN